MYKLVVLDLDGTLLNSQKIISKYTCDVLKKINKNLKIVFASARGFKTIKPYIEKLNLLSNENFTIAFNGSLILDNLENIIEKSVFNEEEEDTIEKYMEKYIETSWVYYTYEQKISKENIENEETFLKENDIYKIVGIDSPNKIKDMRKQIPKLISEKFEITSSEEGRIEFIKSGKNKAQAIQILIDKLNIKRENVIAIGDGENDIEMLKFAGCGIAMGNAIDIVKANADIVTDTNDNDGVGKILNRLIK